MSSYDLHPVLDFISQAYVICWVYRLSVRIKRLEQLPLSPKAKYIAARFDGASRVEAKKIADE